MNKTLKGLLKSKVFWINFLMIVGEIVNELNGSVIPTKYAVEAIAIVNILLRVLTRKPLSEKANSVRKNNSPGKADGI